jgi:hypothetical protein
MDGDKVMQTYWDAYLDEMGAKLHDKTLRQILEDFWMWHQRQVSKQCESAGWISGEGAGNAPAANAEVSDGV